MKVIHASSHWSGKKHKAKTGGYILTTEDGEKHLVSAEVLAGNPLTNGVFAADYPFNDLPEQQDVEGKTYWIATGYITPPPDYSGVFSSDPMDFAKPAAAEPVDTVKGIAKRGAAMPSRTKQITLPPKVFKDDKGEECIAMPDDAPDHHGAHFDGKAGHWIFTVPDDDP